MPTNSKAIGLALVCAILVATAQVFQKLGADRLPELITNWPLFLGILLYGLGFLALITAFKEGEVTVIFPIVATSYVIVPIFAYYVFDESLGIMKIIGMILLFAGVVCIGRDRKI